MTMQYIVRVPRFDSAKVGNDVAALHFVNRYTAIAAPKVIQWDVTDQNELGSPFQIQNRIPGTPLLSTYPNLTHAERCRLAHELGTVFAEMLAVKGSIAGVFVLPSHNNCQAQESQINIGPLRHNDAKSHPSSQPFSSSAPTMTVFELLTGCLQVQKEYGLLRSPPLAWKIEQIDQFMAMVSELDEDGWLVNDHFSLAHLDFHPRNLLVNPTSDTQLPILSAVLDWDSAIIGPMFMSCQPPLWLWGWLDDDDEDEQTANDVPPTAEPRELKELFENAAGPDYLRFAYQPAYRLARQLVNFILKPIRSHEEYKEANIMLQEWEAIRKARISAT
ncbi:hypothetical protein F5B18DRAFT_625340 [Nemania serpens]|nr:hypothetical protein F5B18DRAFT_625340 [Nemania serpens]